MALAGLVALDGATLFLSAIAAAPLALLMALTLAAFAANKVQGFALVKGLGALFLPVALAWFVAMPAQLAFGLLPVYWPQKLCWMLIAGEPGAAWALAAALACHAAYGYPLWRRWDAVAHR